MYSKASIAGHPIHPMLIAFPLAGYTGALVGYAMYIANGSQFWLNFAIALNVAGVAGALAAAVPGLIDWAFGIPSRSRAKAVGAIHALLNVFALGLFGANLALYLTHWNGPGRSATLGLTLASAGLACTLAAGTLGWRMVQHYHVGVHLTPAQQSDERAVHSRRPTPIRGERRERGDRAA